MDYFTFTVSSPSNLVPSIVSRYSVILASPGLMAFSCFTYWDGNNCLLMDVGTGDDVETLFKHLNQLGIPENKVIGFAMPLSEHIRSSPIRDMWSNRS